MACTSIVKNAVASSSAVTLNVPLGSLLEHIPTPTLEQHLEHDARQKTKRSKTWRGRKAPKKDLVHQAPLNPSLKGKNIKVFEDPNPIAKNGAPLFINSVSRNGPVDIKVNPAHPRACFYKLLIDSLDQEPSGESFQAQFDPYLDAPSDGEQSSEEEGRSPGLFTPPHLNEDTEMHGWDDKDNDPASHIYNDYGYWRYVSDLDINTEAYHQQLLAALGSLASSVVYMPHSVNCMKCKKKSGQGLIEMLAYSGASLNFTHD